MPITVYAQVKTELAGLYVQSDWFTADSKIALALPC